MELTGGVVNVYSRKVNFLYGKWKTQVLTAWTDLEFSAISQLALVRLEREEQSQTYSICRTDLMIHI
jgi:hypothetical protein